MSSAACREAAVFYRRRDWCPIPVKERSKEPNLLELRPYLNRQATKEELVRWSWPGVGIVTGPLSGVLVLDVDGPQGEAMLREQGHPPTPIARTAGGGLHLYFRHPDKEIRTGIRVAPGLDVKASGGYVVAPPSVGPNGKPYEWIVSPEEAELADPPDWLMRILERPRRNGGAPPVAERIPPGRRNQELASIAGSLRRRGLDQEEIRIALEGVNNRRCDPPLEAQEVEKIARSVARYEPTGNGATIQVNGRRETGAGEPSFNLTDRGNADRLIHRNGANLRYCFSWAKWLFWDGKRWIVDDTGEVLRLAKETVASIYQEAAAAADEDHRKALAKHAMRSESGAKIREMIYLARPEVPVTPEQLDANPMLINCPNGTIDLRTGELREHRREDLITKIAGAGHDPRATAPLWAATLERVLPSPDIRAFFKKLCGYALAGDTSEHVLPVLYGTGANGKSTILNALLSAAGDYGTQAAPDLLVAKKGSHPTELADLFGMRLVASIEVEDGRRLAESLVKQLTGGDRVKARRMRENFWEFEPTHTVFMAVNHKPIVRGTDNAIWRRIRLIPFTETIPPAEQDKKLSEKLRAELPGILAWIVEGCLEWQREGLRAPDEVRRATAGYRSEMDVIGDFLADRCYQAPHTQVAKDELYRAYQGWCDGAGERAETKRKFGMLLKERGFEDGRNAERTRRIWKGIGLLEASSYVRESDTTSDVSGGQNTRKSQDSEEGAGHISGEVPINPWKNEPRGVNGKNTSEVSEVSETEDFGDLRDLMDQDERNNE